MRLDANTTWFNFTCASGDFAVYAFQGREAVCTPYEFHIELVNRSANADIAPLLGTPACLAIADQSGGIRHVHGLIREIRQLHTANAFTHYACVLVPRLWFLDQIIDHRIFQNLSVVEIIQQILKEQGFPAEASSFKLCYSYEPREYCVQYGETDLHFITRLCEEEGIYFYFEHTEESHTLCFCDREGGPKIPGESDIRFYPGSGNVSDTAVISRLTLHQGVHSNAAAYAEWNFQKPKLDLLITEKEPDTNKAPVPPGMLLEQYRHPHRYQLRAGGTKYAKLQVARQLTFATWISCESDVSRYLPSYTFVLYDHPRRDLNARWWVVSVAHEGEQPGVLEHEAPDGRSLRYKSTVRAIPEMTRFVPELEHPKNRVIGDQSAIVTGPEGEEIYPDTYGRVKVQFHWDRLGQWDEKTTCWIRVSQGWAGSGYGTMAIPRVGHEVLVSFLEGDPDRPLITGRVYHDLNRVPYELPEHKTRTVFKSMSTPGEKDKPRGFNELRIEDKKGEEEIYVHAEKDVNAYVKNDWKEHILHDRHETIDHFTYLETRGETHETLRDKRKTELFVNDNLTVHGVAHIAADDKWLLKAGNEIHLKAGAKVVMEAGAELTIKAGGQWVRLDPSGIKTSSSIRMGQGPPGSGSGAGPEVPGAGSGARPEAPGDAGKTENGTGAGAGASGDPLPPPTKKAEEEGIAARANTPPANEAGPLKDRDGTCCKWWFEGVSPKNQLQTVRLCIVDQATDIKYVTIRIFSVVDYGSNNPSRRMDRAVNYDLSTMPAKNKAAYDAFVAKIGKPAGLTDMLNKVNSAVNGKMSYAFDYYLYRSKPGYIKPQDPSKEATQGDYWANVNEIIDSKWYGDCEDYCIMKYVVMRQMGFPEDNMRILTHYALKSNGSGNEGHAVLLAHDGVTWWRLDNKIPEVFEHCKFFEGEPAQLIAPCHWRNFVKTIN